MTKLAFRLALLAVVALAVALPAPAPAALPCSEWTMKTLASGLGSLENVLPDGTGGLLVSASDQDAIVRLTPDGQHTVLVPEVNSPGGLRIKDDVLYFNTGDTLQSGLQSSTDGTIDTFGLADGKRSTFASGLTMPNGLAILPSGDFVTSRDLGSGTGITRVPADDPAHPQTNWVRTSDSNGMAVDPSGNYLYFVETFTNESNVYRVTISDPSQVDVVASLGNSAPPKGLDDMTIDGAGILFIAANGSGEVIRVDPLDGSSCVIASGMRNTSAVKFGAGPGWTDTDLFVVGFDGVVRELTPPAGQVPTPPGASRQEQPPPPSPPAPPPVMTLRSHPVSIAVGRRSCVRFTAIAEGRRVREATVRFAHKSKVTDSHGNAVFCVRPRRPGRLVAVATKPGIEGARRVVRITRKGKSRV